jgi:hypothetical protein
LCGSDAERFVSFGYSLITFYEAPLPESSVVENIPKPPPFHGLKPVVLASVTCAHVTTTSSVTGSIARQATRRFEPVVDRQRHFSATT